MISPCQVISIYICQQPSTSQGLSDGPTLVDTLLTAFSALEMKWKLVTNLGALSMALRITPFYILESDKAADNVAWTGLKRVVNSCKHA